MLFVLGCALGMVAGFASSIFGSISGMLMSLILPMSVVLGWETSLGYIVTLRAITGVTQYLNNLGQGEVNRKSLTCKSKALQVARSAAQRYWQVKCIITGVTISLSLVLPSGDVLPGSNVIMPLSLGFLSIGWVYYICTRKSLHSKLLHVLVVGLLAVFAVVTTKVGLVNSTLVLMFGLYQMRSLTQDLRVKIGPQKSGILKSDNVDLGSAVIIGICSCVMIGFPTGSVTRLGGAKDEVKSIYKSAIIDAVVDTVGLLLFFVQGTTRDSVTSTIGLAVGTTVVLPLSTFVIVASVSLVINLLALNNLDWLADLKTHTHNHFLNFKFSRVVSLLVSLIGLVAICGNIHSVLGIVCIGYIINTLMKEWSINSEFGGVLLCVLPALAYSGLI